MDIFHEYGVFCEYTVQYVIYTVDVCIVYSVGHSLLSSPYRYLAFAVTECLGSHIQ